MPPIDIHSLNELVVLVGLGSGETLRACLSQPRVTEILVYDPKICLSGPAGQANQFAALSLDKRVHLVDGTNTDTVKTSLSRFFYEDQSRFARATNMTVLETDSQEKRGGLSSQDFKALLKELVQQRTSEFAPNEEDSYWGLTNTLRNYPDVFNLPDFANLSNLCKGATGVVVSTGPSLSKSIELLKNCADRLVIFACDSALMSLLKNGITPDFVGCLERLYANSFCFENMPELNQTYLVAPPVVMPETFAAFHGPKFRLHRDIGYENWVLPQPLSRFFVASSVSHLCYVGLRILGCQKILLLGQDLCFDPVTGKSHHAQALTHQLEHGDWMRKQSTQAISTSFETAGFGNHRQVTNAVWNQFRNQYGELISQHGGEVFNLITETHGIPIPHTTRCEPADELNLQKLLPFNKTDFQQAVAQKSQPTKADNTLVKITLGRSRANLTRLCQKSLVTLREISEFLIRHNIAIPNRGHEQKYQQLFARLEARQQEFLQVDGDFFDTCILPLIGTTHVRIGYQLSVAAQNPDLVSRTLSQMELVMEWYRLVYFWCSRALELLDHQNETRWKFW